MSVRRSLSLLVCSLALVVAGCGEDEPTPKIAPPSESPSVSPTPSDAATEAIEKETPEEFIQRWADTSRDMQNTGETAAYKAITRPCETCRDFAKQIEDIYGSGGYVKWDGLAVKRVVNDSGMHFTVWINASPTEYRRSKTANLQRLEGGSNKYHVELSRRDGEFILENFSVLAQ